jgi:hypothetical protein
VPAQLPADVARGTWEQAQAIFDELQHPVAEQASQKLKALA